MKYSSGNHRRGTGRTIQRSRKPIVNIEQTEDTARAHLLQLQHQIAFAKRVGIDVAVYVAKIEEIYAEFPGLKNKEE